MIEMKSIGISCEKASRRFFGDRPGKWSGRSVPRFVFLTAGFMTGMSGLFHLVVFAGRATLAALGFYS